MLKMKSHIFKLTLAALVFGLAASGLALQTKSRVSSGNNIGFQQRLYSTVFGGSHEYPRGSGNYIHTYEGGLGHFLSVVRDINGDGVMEDTSYGGSRGRTVGGNRGSLEAYDILKQGLDAGERTDQWSARVEVNEVWSSLDPDNLARWPAEFRTGRTMDGEPILFGKETMGSMHSDAFNRSYHRSTPPLGVSFEYQFYFLDYGESNDIAYGHLFIRNMSEYIQWNSNPDFVTKTANTKQGQMWGEFSLLYVENYVGIEKVGSTSMDEGWIFHPAKQIKGQADYNGIESGFTRGGHTFVIGYKSLRNASWKGETMELTNCNNMRWGSDFGLAVSLDIGVLASTSQVHRWSKAVRNGQEDDLTDMFKGNLSPWTGRPAVGNPGMLLPTDQRFNQWLWGRAGRINYTAWSALHDFGPRDSTSTDFAFMFCYPANPPMVLKPNSIDYIDDPELQAQLVPMEHMGDVVKLVFEAGYLLPETPIPPPLTIIPGDRQVTITWSNVNLNTPDRYYYFLQANPEIDPNGYYREYDFEGYRLFRNYTGPQDAHKEEILHCSLSQNNIQFYYIDTQDKDLSYSRLRNGLKVWYALVPYDRNYDVKTGVAFSLPAEGTSLTWNRPFPEGYHTVRPRSDASNFRAAELGELTFVPADGIPALEAYNVALAGDGSGKLIDNPMILAPSIKEFNFLPVNAERIKQDKTVYLVCTDQGTWDQGCTGRRQLGTRSLVVKDGNYESVELDLYGGQSNEQRLVLQGPVDSEGISYAVDVTFQQLAAATNYANLYYHMDKGAYTGGIVDLISTAGCGPASRVGTAPSNDAMTKAGRFQITWKDAGGGMLTLEVRDVVRNVTVPHSPYPDVYGWGFQTRAGYGPNMFGSGVRGTYYQEAFVARLPLNQRTVQMPDRLPSSNTEMIGLWLNGCMWRIAAAPGAGGRLGEDGITMPAVGTVWTQTNAFGSWNSAKTVFTQIPDMPWLGDKWQIDIKATTMKDDDINLSLIKVVPNPYIASSVLDQSGGSRRIDFVNLPDKCTIRIYTMGGNLVNVLNHIGSSRTGWGNFVDVDAIQPNNEPFSFTGYDNHSGTEPWNMKNRFGQTVASGLYFYHVTDARGKTHTGKFYIVN